MPSPIVSAYPLFGAGMIIFFISLFVPVYGFGVIIQSLGLGVLFLLVLWILGELNKDDFESAQKIISDS